MIVCQIPVKSEELLAGGEQKGRNARHEYDPETGAAGIFLHFRRVRFYRGIPDYILHSVLRRHTEAEKRGTAELHLHDELSVDAALPDPDHAAAGRGKTEEDGPAAADQSGFPAGHWDDNKALYLGLSSRLIVTKEKVVYLKRLSF